MASLSVSWSFVLSGPPIKTAAHLPLLLSMSLSYEAVCLFSFCSETPSRNPRSPVSCWPDQRSSDPQQQVTFREGKGLELQVAGGREWVLPMRLCAEEKAWDTLGAAGRAAKPEEARLGSELRLPNSCS